MFVIGFECSVEKWQGNNSIKAVCEELGLELHDVTSTRDRNGVRVVFQVAGDMKAVTSGDHWEDVIRQVLVTAYEAEAITVTGEDNKRKRSRVVTTGRGARREESDGEPAAPAV